ncbi:hypothetical protein QBC47DRAFT_397543 [Echria macrotheca]|uniref:Uncharacterized protein n=1 Tax=Echria macrotheca TaxID=438768 RepID=A0AAJ0FFP1_9PEZI|nr:hypothetical protein QBC47DRAFT_397543 [Echria macrotheca]
MGQVILTREDMKSLSDPVLDVILKFVGDQVDQVTRANEPSIQTLVLVGRFGSSPYLKESLGVWCTERDIRLTTPWNGANVEFDPIFCDLS